MQSFFMRTAKTLIRLQADLTLRVAHMSEGTFSDVAAQMGHLIYTISIDPNSCILISV